MRRDHQVIAFDHEVRAPAYPADSARSTATARRRRTRHRCRAPCPANSRPARTGIFADRVHVIVAGNAVDDLRPRLAVIGGLEDVRLAVVVLIVLGREYAVPASCGDASIRLMRANSGMPGGVTFVQFLPPSRVMYTTPSSEPVQMVSASLREGAMVKIVP